MQCRAAARRLARVDADAVGALADLPLALGPQNVADHGVVAAGGRAGQGGGAARDHCVPVFPVSGLGGCWPGAAAADGGGHVGLLAFLLACSVLRAALLLAGAVPRESAVVWTGCPATGEAISGVFRQEVSGSVSFRVLKYPSGMVRRTLAWQKSLSHQLQRRSFERERTASAGRLPTRLDSFEAQRCRSTGAAAP